MNIDLSAVFTYYNDCWDNRFIKGHNSISHACHYGFYSEPDKTNLNNTQSEYDKSKKKLNDKLIQIIDKEKDEKLVMLDAGCGYGGTILDLLNYYKNCYIYGITLTETQIKYTNNIIKSNNYAKSAEVICGNFNNYNFDIVNNSIKYDIIYFIESICHSECKEKTIEIALSMLKNNGKIIIFDYFENVDNNLEKHILDIVALDKIKNGMALPSFINLKMIKNVTNKFSIHNVNNNILPGMKYSKEKAEKKLESGNIKNENMINHLQSCINMYDLHFKNILNYTIVVIEK